PVDARNLAGSTALYAAAENDRVAVRRLLDKGACRRIRALPDRTGDRCRGRRDLGGRRRRRFSAGGDASGSRGGGSGRRQHRRGGASPLRTDGTRTTREGAVSIRQMREPPSPRGRQG